MNSRVHFASVGVTRYRTEKKLATGLCVPFVDISLRAYFYSASHFSKEIRARVFAWHLKRHTVLYRLSKYLLSWISYLFFRKKILGIKKFVIEKFCYKNIGLIWAILYGPYMAYFFDTKVTILRLCNSYLRF